MRRAVALLLFCLTAPAYALSVQDSPSVTPEMTKLLPKVKGDTVPWQLFATTKEKQKKVTFPDGGYSFEVTPIFGDKLKELGGRQVTLYGFMFPLEQAEKQGNFLLGPFPPSCPFHYHAPPSLIVEVKSRKPVEFSWDAITLKGTLELMEKDPNGSYYILRDATLE